jgi:putative ABC transport system substrate-binding protein
MKRREFISILGGAAAASAWPLRLTAQQQPMPVVGFLHGASAGPFAHVVQALRQGLGEAGYSEGRNVTLEYRWAEGHYDRLPAFAADLVRRQVAVIFATGGVPAIQAAKAATTTIPIVFVFGSDPVESGIVPSLNRPGGNITGISFISSALGPKRLELLREIAPGSALIGVLVNSKNATSVSERELVQTAARSLGQDIQIVNASSEDEIEKAFAVLEQARVTALIVCSDPYFQNRGEQLAALAIRHRLATIAVVRELAAAGLLMSYGASLADTYRQAGAYVGRILKGAKPADLPVQLPTKFELVINLKTAAAIGLKIPDSFYWRANEVIE